MISSGLLIYYVRKISEKQFLTSCTYQGVRNVSFTTNFAYVLKDNSMEVEKCNKRKKSIEDKLGLSKLFETRIEQIFNIIVRSF